MQLMEEEEEEEEERRDGEYHKGHRRALLQCQEIQGRHFGPSK